MKNILVSGATGFIGKSLCARLVTNGGQVRAAVWSNMQFVDLPSGINAVSISSIGPDTEWRDALSGIDTVVHLAARVHVMDETSEDALALYHCTNVAGSERLAKAAATYGVKRLVFLSTVKVHGEETPVPYREDDSPSPCEPYGISKWEAEVALRKVAAETGLEVVIIRSPLVYGPGVKANFLQLLSIVDRGVPLPVKRVKNCRSLIYLGNLIDAIITCATHPQAAGQTFLVSDGEDISMPELILRVANALNRPLRTFGVPLFLIRLFGRLTGKTAVVDRLLGSLVVDSGKIRRELNWKPPYTMAEGLRETAAWYATRSGSR